MPHVHVSPGWKWGCVQCRWRRVHNQQLSSINAMVLPGSIRVLARWYAGKVAASGSAATCNCAGSRRREQNRLLSSFTPSINPMNSLRDVAKEPRWRTPPSSGVGKITKSEVRFLRNHHPSAIRGSNDPAVNDPSVHAQFKVAAKCGGPSRYGHCLIGPQNRVNSNRLRRGLRPEIAA